MELKDFVFLSSHVPSPHPSISHPSFPSFIPSQGDYARAWRHYLTAHGLDPSNTLLLENMEKLRRAQDLKTTASGLPHCLTKS